MSKMIDDLKTWYRAVGNTLDSSSLPESVLQHLN